MKTLSCLGLAAGLSIVATVAFAGSPNGRAGTMPAFYDDQLFTINFKELPSGGEASTLAHNKSINTIYMSDQCESEGVMFVSVLDAIQPDDGIRRLLGLRTARHWSPREEVSQ